MPAVRLPGLHLFLFLLLPLCPSGAQQPAAPAPAPAPTLREPVHPRRNVEEFPAVTAKVVRFTVLKTVRGEVCLDELEIYGPDNPSKNLALSENGTIPRTSGTLPEYRIHALNHINDGLYGNGHSWISNSTGYCWVQLELPAPARINRIVWGRDREGKFNDRLATDYYIEVSATSVSPTEPLAATDQWREVASSKTRAPLELVLSDNPGYESAMTRITPAVTDLAGSTRPASREYLMENWQTSRGLPSNTVTSLLQTRDGWLWVGTTNGIARFDGQRFRTFGETSGLPGLSVTCLVEDAMGTLWAGTEGSGLARWDGRRFHALATGTDREGNTVLALGADPAGSLWVATRGGLQEVRGESITKRSGNIISRIIADSRGLWLTVASALWRWDGTALTRAQALGDSPLVPEERSLFSSLSALAAGPDDTLWFGGANGYIGKFAGGVATNFGEGHPILSSSVWELLAARNGDVWLGTSGTGLGRLRDGAILQFTTDDGLPTNSIRALCEDREGNVWAGTAGGGLTRLSARRIEAITARDGLSHNAVMALAEGADGTVWIGTNGGGLNRWHAGKVAPHAPTYVLENKCISSLAVSPDGSLCVGTSDSGMLRLSDSGAKIIDLPPRASVAALCYDQSGGLWFGTLNAGPGCLVTGVNAEGIAEDITLVPNELQPLVSQPVTSLLADAAGGMWFGTAGQGLARLAENTLTRWRRTDGLASDFVRTVRADSSGTVWIGTSGGLTRWKDGRLFTYTAAHGLPDTFISQILDDQAGHLWLGTNRGVLRVALTSLDDVARGETSLLDVLALGTGDGLPSLECTGGYHPAGLRLRDGRLCFGTVAGLAVVDPARFSSPAALPPVVFEEVTPGTSPESYRPGITSFSMPENAGRLGISYTALHFTAPERVRYRYRMTGFEKNWVEAGADHAASYTHLPPGDFRFEVIASADGSTWSAPATLNFRVLAPWWKTPWGYAGLVLLTLTGVALFVRVVTRRRMQRRLRAAEQNLALERERTRIARDIHDDLGATLTQISLLSAIGREKRADPDIAGEQFNAINTTAGELVQSLDAIVWAVNPRHDTLESLARYITRFAGDFTARSPVRLRLNVPPELPNITLSSEVRHNVFLAFKEALNNALRHANATEVRIAIATDPSAAHCTITVEDDGRGFTPGTSTDGDGLENMRRRLTDCGGSCEITTAPARGTTITFTLPLLF